MAEQESWNVLPGGCYCSNIRYELHCRPIFTNCCHCRNCQKLSGSAFAINTIVEKSAIHITSTSQPVLPPEGKPGMARCEHCKVGLWASIPYFGEGIVFLRVGTLDEGEKVLPDAHFFVRSKHAWVQIPEDVRKFDALPPRDGPPLYGPEAKARMEAANGVKKEDRKEKKVEEKG